MSAETRTCQNCRSDFIIDDRDFAFYQKINVPPPTFCPECRLIRRLAWRNERFLYNQICVKCGKDIISVFAKDTGLAVYCSQCWWSDEWDGLEYGTHYDPSRPFLNQLHDLFQKVPVMNLFGLYTTLINSDYTNMVSYLKNCYMVTYCDVAENITYGSFIEQSKDSMDNLMLSKSELCYGCTHIAKCYRAFFSEDSEDSHDIYFSKDLVGCSYCFGCANLRNKKYYIYNEPHTKEEFTAFLAEANLGSAAKAVQYKTEAEAHWIKFPRKYYHGRHNVNVSGDYILNSKNVSDSFIVKGAEDSRYCAFADAATGKMTDVYDFVNYGLSASLIYETLQAGNQVSRIFFSWWAVTDCQQIEYSWYSIGSKNLFGSVGLKKREYCILNKQYAKEEFEKLRAQIIEDMNKNPYIDKKGNMYKYGEAFPIEMSPFGYNETTAQEFFPLSKEEAVAQSYPWRVAEARDYKTTIDAEDLPDHISDAADSILNETIRCAHNQKCNDQCSIALRIVPQELKFYRKMNLPLPHLCPNCRHAERTRKRNPMKLWERECGCKGEMSENGAYKNMGAHPSHAENSPCPNRFKTAYAPERPSIVYCEECYNAEVA